MEKTVDRSQESVLSAASASTSALPITSIATASADTLRRELIRLRTQYAARGDQLDELQRQLSAARSEKRTTLTELDEAHDRLRGCKNLLHTQRRAAADWRLKTVSLTAERDDLEGKVQDAWKRVAELLEELQRHEVERRRLEEALRRSMLERGLSSQAQENELYSLAYRTRSMSQLQEQLEHRHAVFTLAVEAAVRVIAESVQHATASYLNTFTSDAKSANSTTLMDGSGGTSLASAAAPSAMPPLYADVSTSGNGGGGGRGSDALQEHHDDGSYYHYKTNSSGNNGNIKKKDSYESAWAKKATDESFSASTAFNASSSSVAAMRKAATMTTVIDEDEEQERDARRAAAERELCVIEERVNQVLEGVSGSITTRPRLYDRQQSDDDQQQRTPTPSSQLLLTSPVSAEAKAMEASEQTSVRLLLAPMLASLRKVCAVLQQTRAERHRQLLARVHLTEANAEAMREVAVLRSARDASGTQRPREHVGVEEVRRSQEALVVAEEARRSLSTCLRCGNEWTAITAAADALRHADTHHEREYRDAVAYVRQELEPLSLAQAAELQYLRTANQQLQADIDALVLLRNAGPHAEESANGGGAAGKAQITLSARKQFGVVEGVVAVTRAYSGLALDFAEVIQQRRALARLVLSRRFCGPEEQGGEKQGMEVALSGASARRRRWGNGGRPLLSLRVAVVAVLAANRLLHIGQACAQQRYTHSRHSPDSEHRGERLAVRGCPRISCRVRLPAETRTYILGGALEPTQLDCHSSSTSSTAAVVVSPESILLPTLRTSNDPRDGPSDEQSAVCSYLNSLLSLVAVSVLPQYHEKQQQQQPSMAQWLDAGLRSALSAPRLHGTRKVVHVNGEDKRRGNNAKSSRAERKGRDGKTPAQVIRDSSLSHTLRSTSYYTPASHPYSAVASPMTMAPEPTVPYPVPVDLGEDVGAAVPHKDVAASVNTSLGSHYGTASGGTLAPPLSNAFAKELLGVIGALDRRVEGALQRNTRR